MNETSILILVFGLLGYIASFLFGYFLCKSRGKGLASDTELRPDVSGNLKEDADRIGDLADGLDEVIAAGDDVTDIFKRYAFEAEERAKLEQNPDRDDSGLPGN